MMQATSGHMLLSRQHQAPPAEPVWHYTPRGLEIAPGLSYDQWRERLATLIEMHRSILLWIGDALVYGEDQYGEDFSGAIPEYRPGTLANAMSVCRRFPPSQRCESRHLTFSHYAAVASLPDQHAYPLLREADTDKLSSRRLARLAEEKRTELEMPSLAAAPQSPQVVQFVCADCGSLNVVERAV